MLLRLLDAWFQDGTFGITVHIRHRHLRHGMAGRNKAACFRTTHVCSGSDVKRTAAV